ncbi:hypothetical protein EV193_110215 [Herbihabitans rhizosphaerae]|uniref:Uncharacterized protein n=1 Tax=Herbihabitans rhizosphaerae TaxID=1872711 RepID=A0A4Q7KIM4_9PSEU|nr:hypothetical protein [Herbihabitans rhizosphaerae]RZS34065.1 hypothetical protein EV193_110215 [Herbihabitans rhizosphaerae]
MVNAISAVLITVSLLASVWALVLIFLNRSVRPDHKLGLWLMYLIAVFMVGLLVQAVVGIVNLIATDRELHGATFVGYLIAPLLIVPFAGFMALAERSRYGPAVLMIGCLSIPALIVRMHQLWAGHA